MLLHDAKEAVADSLAFINFKIRSNVVSTPIHESFLEAAETDLEAAKATLKAGLFSQTLYLIEHSLEKSTKSLYAYYLLDYDHMSEEHIYAIIKRLGHDNSRLYQKYIQKYVK